MFYFCICVLAFFAVIGLCFVCRGIAQAMGRSRDEREIILIEAVGKDCRDAEFMLRSAAQKVMWMGRTAPDRVICLDCGMDGETRRLCDIVCRDYPFMELYTRDELHRKIDEIQ